MLKAKETNFVEFAEQADLPSLRKPIAVIGIGQPHETSAILISNRSLVPGSVPSNFKQSAAFRVGPSPDYADLRLDFVQPARLMHDDKHPDSLRTPGIKQDNLHKLDRLHIKKKLLDVVGQQSQSQEMSPARLNLPKMDKLSSVNRCGPP